MNNRDQNDMLFNIINDSPHFKNNYTYFNNISIDSINQFLKEYKINISNSKINDNDMKDFYIQLKILRYLILISSPLNMLNIYTTNYDMYGFEPELSKINEINLICKRNELPIHIGAYGDSPHFTLEIVTNRTRNNYHLYLNGVLTSGVSQIYSYPIPMQFFKPYIKQQKKNKLSAKAKPFVPK